MSYLLFIRPPLETRKIHIHTVLFPEPKVRQRKLKYAKILSKTPRENYFLSEVYINTSFASGIFNELSHLLLSTLETCLNSFQTPIPFLSRRNRTNESEDMPQKLHSNAPSYLKSFLSVTNLTSHEYIFSRVKLTSCALIRSDWFSASLRPVLALARSKKKKKTRRKKACRLTNSSHIKVSSQAHRIHEKWYHVVVTALLKFEFSQAFNRLFRFF